MTLSGMLLDGIASSSMYKPDLSVEVSEVNFL